MDHTLFRTKAEAELAFLSDALEDTLPHDADIDYVNDILTITLSPTHIYVLNKHTPTCQLWVSSPKSGAHHCIYDAGKDCWISTKGLPLRELLEKELGVSLS